MKKFKLFFCILLSLTIFNTLKSAEQIDPIKVDWSFKGLLGKFDRASLQRGYQVYNEVCASCHSMQYLSYRIYLLSELQGASQADLVYLLPRHGDEGHLPDEGDCGQDGDDEAKENRFQPFIRNLFELPQMSRVSLLVLVFAKKV